MTFDEINARVRKLTRINLKIAHYLKVCDLTHRSETGEPCEDPRCKAIARRYFEIEEEILSLLDVKYALANKEPFVVDRLLNK